MTEITTPADLLAVAELQEKATEGTWESLAAIRATIGGHGHTVWPIATTYEVEPGWRLGCALVILPDEDNTPENRQGCVNRAAFIAAARSVPLYKLARLWEAIAGHAWPHDIMCAVNMPGHPSPSCNCSLREIEQALNDMESAYEAK